MADDGKVIIGTELDTDGLDKGLKGVDGKLKGATKTTGGFSAGLLKAGAIAAGLGVAIKTVSKVVGDLTNAYKAQEKAETQLEQAAKNNPLLDGSSVAQLKKYASELQGIGTIGDEELLPFMAQLASAGRSQDEIMKIMAASLDIAASGAMSMDSAVRNLNKSFGGFSGELGETVPEIKALTQEELKQGKAVDILAGRYKGMAAEVAKTTGTSEQLKNAFGDLKEELGAPFEKGIGPVRAFFTELISGWADAKKKKREYEESTEALAAGSTESTDFQKKIDGEKERLAYLQSQYALLQKQAKLSDAELVRMRTTRAALEKQLGAKSTEIYQQTILVQKLDDQLATAQRIEKEAGKAAKDAAESAKQEAERLDIDQKALDYIEANRKAREQALEVLRLEAEFTGDEIDQAAVLAIYQQSYVDLLTQSNGLVTANDAKAKELLAETIKIAESYQPILNAQKEQAAFTEDITTLTESLGEIQRELSDSDVLRQQLDQLDIQYNAVINNALITADEKAKIDNEYARAKQLLEENITKLEQEQQQERLDSYLETVNNFASTYASIMTGIAELATKGIEAEVTERTSIADQQYANGIISAEEYQKRLAEIDKEAAEKKYKLDMWKWSADILMATANTALAASKALSEGGAYAGPILMALALAAGGIQIGAIIASKPQPPAFATGGIVGGTSYTGDNVLARLDSAEMILNNRQQRNLFDAVNSGSLGGGGINIQVINSAANDVSAKPVITEDGVRIMIRKTVAKDMKDGRFDSSYRSMRSGLSGTRLTT